MKFDQVSEAFASHGFVAWLALVGALLLLMALSSAQVRRLPVSTAAIYLVLGMAMGPQGLGWFRIDIRYEQPWFERATEIAVIVSLFVSGLKMRQVPGSAPWKAATLLAGPVMLGTISCVALFGYAFLGLEPALAVLLGAVLAPTDPVLASAVSVSHAGDDDKLRYGLSGEAGLNDGMAFPFVVFGLSWLKHGELDGWIASWFVHSIVWAVPVGLLLGFLLGQRIGKLSMWLRSHHSDSHAPSDFLALALIALSYAAAELVGAWGFLAAFAAGVGLRSAELQVVHETPHPDVRRSSSTQRPFSHPPAEDFVPQKVTDESVREPSVAAGVLVAQSISFGDTAERLLEFFLVVLVGVSLAGHWDVRAVPLAGVFFLLIRPIWCMLCLRSTETTTLQRLLLGWFGIRGIGSLYYLGYLLRNDLSKHRAHDLVNLTISVVAISIVVHGITATPVLARYERRRAR